jgi:hypothetical protein
MGIALLVGLGPCRPKPAGPEAEPRARRWLLVEKMFSWSSRSIEMQHLSEKGRLRLSRDAGRESGDGRNSEARPTALVDPNPWIRVRADSRGVFVASHSP